jgi:hypothetical protein
MVFYYYKNKKNLMRLATGTKSYNFINKRMSYY